MAISPENSIYDPFEVGQKIPGRELWLSLHEGNNPRPFSWAKKRKPVRFTHASWGLIETEDLQASWVLPVTTEIRNGTVRIWDRQTGGAWLLKLSLKNDAVLNAGDTFTLADLTIAVN